MGKTPQDVLFDYLRDVLYKPDRAVLDVESLPEEFRKLGEGLRFLGHCAAEQKSFGAALTRGEINTKAPSVENGLASALKALQGALLHITWQTQQVAKGDYSQKLDFMGEFSQAFNSMTMQLKERQDALLEEKERLAHRNRELARSHALFLVLTQNATEWVVVVHYKTGAVLFENKAAQELNEANPSFCQIVRNRLLSCPEDVINHPVGWEVSFIGNIQSDQNTQASQTKTLWLSIESHFIEWEGAEAVAHVISDHTAEKEQAVEMHRLAYVDGLTDLFNRRYGMDMMQDWMDRKKTFSVSFVDIDYLKYCNDVFGHEAGNKYILEVAALLRRVPEPRVICRIGGDEFMIIKEDASAAEMDACLSALRGELLLAKLPETAQYRHSFSYGSCDVLSGTDQTLSDVLEQADERMYKFKIQFKRAQKTEGAYQDDRM